MKPPEPDHLHHLLQSWSNLPAPDPKLAVRVQRRVAAARTARGAFWFMRSCADLSWPRLAFASVCLGIVLGIAAAEFRGWLELRGPDQVERYREWILPIATRQTLALRS